MTTLPAAESDARSYYAATATGLEPLAPLEGDRRCDVCIVGGAGRHVKRGGGLFLYGPFRRGGQHTAPSNAAFDASLRAQDPAWGVRDLEAVTALAAAAGFAPPLVETMPANNLSLWFAKP